MCEQKPKTRLMRVAQGPSRVAYNVLGVVDVEHRLILNHGMTQEASDLQLVPLAEAAQLVLVQTPLTVVADAGYSSGKHLTQCAERELTAFLPPNWAINHQVEEALLQKSDFIYGAQWRFLSMTSHGRRASGHSGRCSGLCSRGPSADVVPSEEGLAVDASTRYRVRTETS